MTLLQGQFGLLPERADGGSTALHPPHVVASLIGHIAEASSTEVAARALLGMSPGVLCRVQLRSMSPQVLQLDRTLAAVDVVADDLTVMSGPPIPDHQHLLPDLPRQGVQERHYPRPLDRSGERSKVEAIERDAGRRRDLMPVNVILQHRCLPVPPPATHARGSLAQSRFVDEDDESALLSGVLPAPATAAASNAGSQSRRTPARGRWAAGWRIPGSRKSATLDGCRRTDGRTSLRLASRHVAASTAPC